MFVVYGARNLVREVVVNRRLSRLPIRPRPFAVERVHPAQLFEPLAQRILFLCHIISIPRAFEPPRAALLSREP
jgi:hypothetical protein